MVWNSLSEFFHMGGYALYVWGSVIVTFGFMVTELIILKLRRQAIIDHLGRANAFGEDDLDEVVEKERDETAS
jgi:heme exporter protein D